MVQKRQYHLDIITMVLLFEVIYLNHFRYFSGVATFWGFDTLYKLLYFAMPWFFFKSGMFYNKKRTVKEVMANDFRRNVITFLVGCALAMIIQAVYLLLTGQFDAKSFFIRNAIDIFNHGGASWNIALYFLMSLYIVKVLYRWLNQYIENGVIIAVASIAVSYTLYRFNIFRPAAIGNIPLGMFFYAMGHILKDVQYNKYVFWGALSLSILFFCLGIIHSFSFRLNTVSVNDYYLLTILSSICSIIVFNYITSKMPTPPDWLLYVGRNSMTFYVLHYPFGCLMADIGKNYLGLLTFSLYAFVSLSATLLLIIATVVIEKSNNKYINLIIGK